MVFTNHNNFGFVEWSQRGICTEYIICAKRRAGFGQSWHLSGLSDAQGALSICWHTFGGFSKGGRLTLMCIFFSVLPQRGRVQGRAEGFCKSKRNLQNSPTTLFYQDFWSALPGALYIPKRSSHACTWPPDWSLYCFHRSEPMISA